MSLEREWLAALALQYVDTNNSSVRKSLDRIFENSEYNNHLIRSTVNALVTETIRRKNIIDRLANYALDRSYQFKQSPYPSLKRLDTKLRNLLRILIYRIKFEKHQSELVLNTTKIILSEKYPNFVSLFVNWLSMILELEVDQFIDNLDDPIEKLALKTWEPYFLVKRFCEVYNEKAEVILKYFKTNSPIYLRINHLKDKTVAFEELNRKNVVLEQDKYMTDVYKVITSDIPIARLDGFKNGYFYIQSRSSCFITYFLNPQQNDKILDSCSAPGSKTTHISSLTNDTSNITALEIDPKRILMLKDTLTRSNVQSVSIVEGDARNPPLEKSSLFDKILLDAPCSGSGILSTKAHAKWRIKNSLIKKYAQLQFEILDSVANFLKKDGFLLYSTCSLLPEENEEVVSKFLGSNRNFKPVELNFPELGEELILKGKRLLPQEVDSEGFSVFLLKRTS